MKLAAKFIKIVCLFKISQFRCSIRERVHPSIPFNQRSNNEQRVKKVQTSSRDSRIRINTATTSCDSSSLADGTRKPPLPFRPYEARGGKGPFVFVEQSAAIYFPRRRMRIRCKSHDAGSRQWDMVMPSHASIQPLDRLDRRVRP